MEMHPNGKDTSQGGNPKDHLGEADLLLYLEGSLKEKEALAIQRHLNACSHCLGLIASAHGETLTVENKKEINALLANVDLDVEKQLQRLVDTGLVKPDKPSPGPALATSFIVFLAGIWQALRQHSRPYFATTGSLVSVALLIFFVGAPQYFAYKSNVLVEESLFAMIEDYDVQDRSTPRPSGGFKYALFGRTRGPQNDDSDPIAANFQRAIELNENNAKALQYLGTHYLVAKSDYQKARQAYEAAYAIDSTNAALRNDFGLMAWYEKKYNDAEKYFAQALQIDVAFAEAQYNLAIMLEQQMRTQDAIRAWKKYLKIDSASSWAKIAKEHLEKLRNELSDNMEVDRKQ